MVHSNLVYYYYILSTAPVAMVLTITSSFASLFIEQQFGVQSELCFVTTL